jgi:coniferyl-aldehyde dehydrogenase
MVQTCQAKQADVIENEAQRVFSVQHAAYMHYPYPSAEERIENLHKVERILIDNADAIADAINTDYGCRSVVESKLLEIFTSVDGIRYARKKVRSWMKPQRRHVSILFATGSNRVIPQPKGVVGIVSPWNYPLFLAIGPLTYALAAGNRCMVKLATNSSTLCQLLADKFKAQFPEDTVAILPGVKAQDFSALPFDHMVFTGSADVGRTVMRSAAEGLTPVTLELGGKSPTIICDDFDVETAAERILYAKFVNAGQTCVAPDYLFVPEAKRDQFVAAAQRILTHRYPDPNNGSYTSIVDEKAYRRLRGTLDDAEKKGAKVISPVAGAILNDKLRKIPPQLVLDPTDDMIIMRDEIFGPLLPVKTYRSIEEVLAYIKSKDRPLALYFFTHDKQLGQRILYQTISGGVTINNCLFQVAQHDMPFGGTGASGMGQYHGYEGFVELSKMRGVFTNPKVSALHLFYPPYTKLHTRMFELLLKYKR